MVYRNDRLALWIALLIIAFSLFINLGLASLVGEVVRGPSGIFLAKEPLELTLEELAEGVVLIRGNTHLILPQELVGEMYADVFATVKGNVRFVEDDYTKTFRAGKRIWVAHDKKQIVKYTRDGFYTPVILSREVNVHVFGASHVVWVYTPSFCEYCQEITITSEEAAVLARNYFLSHENPSQDCKEKAPTAEGSQIETVTARAQSGGYLVTFQIKCDVSYGLYERYEYFVTSQGVEEISQDENYS
ncbi:MAG: hypothetical protein AABX86_00330 [Nanoarchaeota archaeon]